ncbi:MAG: nitroreductase family protein [Elusimicrobiota bacterium]
MLIDLLKARRSIRKFKSSPVEESKIKYIIECGRISPSACNLQPYRFIVLSGGFKKRFDEAVFSGIYSVCSFVKKAPLSIVIVRLKPGFKTKIGSKLQDTDFSLIDIGIAGEHMIMAACELGLGSLWVGWFDKKKAFDLLSLNRGETAEVMIVIGEKDEDPYERKKKNFDEIVIFKNE